MSHVDRMQDELSYEASPAFIGAECRCRVAMYDDKEEELSTWSLMVTGVTYTFPMDIRGMPSTLSLAHCHFAAEMEEPIDRCGRRSLR